MTTPPVPIEHPAQQSPGRHAVSPPCDHRFIPTIYPSTPTFYPLVGIHRVLAGVPGYTTGKSGRSMIAAGLAINSASGPRATTLPRRREEATDTSPNRTTARQRRRLRTPPTVGADTNGGQLVAPAPRERRFERLRGADCFT